jgi:AMP-binding enzyme
VILDDPSGRKPAGAAHTTLDELFRRNVARRPDALALVDPPDRERFADGPARRLTYAEVDRMASAIAGRLRRLGLPLDCIVGLQLPNTVESVLALLGVWRAGLIAMPLPLLWRQADAADALRRVGAGALLVASRVGEIDYFDLAMQIAAETFCVRHVCGFGKACDGVVSFDDLYTANELDPVPPSSPERAGPPGPGAHLALVTWDVTSDVSWDMGSAGLVPVARSHAQLISGGVAVLLESRVRRNATLLSTMTLSSFAGLASAMLPWLLTGGALVLHQPFLESTFARQRHDFPCDAVIVPGAMAAKLADAGHLSAPGLKNVVAVWRAPEQVAQASAWTAPAGMTDVLAFGEVGLIAGRRDASGWPAPIPLGTVDAPRGGLDSIFMLEVAATPEGTIALRGPMVPGAAFPPGADRTHLPHLKVAETGFVDTGYPCRIDRDGKALAVTGAPAGTVNVGGYRFVLRDVQDVVGGIAEGGTLVALPDGLAGTRLAGVAADAAAMRDALARLGVNPLLVEAFDPRREDRPQAA